MLTSATLFVRSLRPAYRHERLSFRTADWGAKPKTFLSVVRFSSILSIAPVRLTRWTKVTTMIANQGLSGSGRLFGIGAFWGIFYVFTVEWLLWPASGFFLPICIGASAVLFVLFLRAVWRGRSVFPTIMPKAYEGTAFEFSWPYQAPPKKKRAAKSSPAVTRDESSADASM